LQPKKKETRCSPAPYHNRSLTIAFPCRAYEPNRIRRRCPQQTKGSCSLCKRGYFLTIQV
jgi:hypothetical protein